MDNNSVNNTNNLGNGVGSYNNSAVGSGVNPNQVNNTQSVVQPTNVVEQPKSYLNINNVTPRSNGNVSSTINVTALDDINEMSEERRNYLLEKEKMIASRKKKKGIITKVILSIIFIVVFGYGYKYYFRPVKIDERIDKDSIHYLTDLYYSDGRYYEKYLDEKGKKLYLTIFNSLKNVEKYLKIDCQDFGYDTKISCGTDIELSYRLILIEHPDMFWYRGYGMQYSERTGFDITHHLVSTNKIELYFTERRLLRKLDEVAKQYEDLSDYEKVHSVYTWLGENRKYTDGIKTRKDGTAWSALLGNETVCAGFAAASQLLLQRLDIESTVVLGYTSDYHAWNFVYLEDGYYWYDSTWGGSAGKGSPYFYNGFLFKNRGDYKTYIFDEKEIQWGTKYLES